MNKPLKIVSVSSEVSPYSKAGGLGDVARSLPKALKRLGHEVTVITPLYGTIDKKEKKLKRVFNDIPIVVDDKTTLKVDFWQGELMEGLPIYFVDNYRFFRRHKVIYGGKDDNARFLFFDLASLKLLQLLEQKPDIIQCHEWHTGLIPFFIKKWFRKDPILKGVTTIFTIHNLTFQLGSPWWLVPPEKKDDGHKKLPPFNNENIQNINFAKRGIIYADLINTVSGQYAQEILTRSFGQDLNRILKNRQDRLYGIINGIDYDDYNPSTDPGLVKSYDAQTIENKAKNKAYIQKKFSLPQDAQAPLIAMISRITEQKGFDLVMEIIEPLLRLESQLIIVGSGDKKYENFFRKVSKVNRKKLATHLKFETKNVTQIYAASDMFLMPSRFEPSGLGQLISLRYGSVPIVHATGGLLDTITNFNPWTKRGNGFSFKTYDSRDLLVAIVRALETYKNKILWQQLVQNGMQQSSSWEIPARKYIELFRKAIKIKKGKSQ